MLCSEAENLKMEIWQLQKLRKWWEKFDSNPSLISIEVFLSLAPPSGKRKFRSHKKQIVLSAYKCSYDFKLENEMFRAGGERLDTTEKRGKMMLCMSSGCQKKKKLFSLRLNEAVQLFLFEGKIFKIKCILHADGLSNQNRILLFKTKKRCVGVM